MLRETVRNGSLVHILDGPAVASGNGLKQWSPNSEGVSYPYQEVKDASERISGLLQEQGVEHGDRVMLWGPNSPQWPMSVFGVLRAGAISVPFDVNADPEFFHKVFEATQPRAIIAGPDQRKSLPKEYGVPVLEMEQADELHPQESYNHADRDVSSQDLAQIVFTSGSTGNPKGVMLSHGNIDSNVRSLSGVVPLDSDNRLLSLLPLSHMFEFNPGLLTPMYLGASVVYTDTRALRARPEYLMQAIHDEQITAMAVVPEVLKLMKMGIEHRVAKEGPDIQRKFKIAKNISPYLPKALRRRLFSTLHEKMGGEFEFFLTGGSHLDSELADYWEHMGVTVLQGYGMTEASPVVTADRLHGRSDHRYVGRPIPGVEVKLVKDEETDTEEIYIRGPGVMQGYWNNDEGTGEVLDKDGWYHTHDIGRMDRRERLQVFGRNDFMISLPDGHNVFPEDLEQVILRHTEGVLKNAMVFYDESGKKKKLHAVLFPAPTSMEIDAEGIRRETNQHLADFQRIDRVSTWPDDLPVPETPTRKLKRKVIIQQIREGEQSRAELEK